MTKKKQNTNADTRLRLQLAGACREAGGAENLFDGDAQLVQFFGGKPFLHALEQFPLLTPDVRRQKRCEGQQSRSVHRACGGAIDSVAELYVLVSQVAHQRFQLRKPFGGREEHALLGIEVEADLLVEEAHHLAPPCLEFYDSRARATLNPDAKRKRVLMLAGEGMERGIA